MWAWLIIIVGVFAVPLLIRVVRLCVIAPIRVHRKQTFKLDADCRETRPEDLTPEMKADLARLLPEFKAAGFEVVANVYQPESAPGVNLSHVFLVNRTSGDTASVAQVHGRVRRAFTLMVRTRFEDGTSVVSASSRTPGLFPRDPKVDGAKFPWVTSAGALVEVHRRRLRGLGRDSERPVLPEPGQEVAFLTEHREQEVDRLVQCGYKWKDLEHRVSRFTWKGAFLVTWKTSRPVKLLRISRQERKGRRIWKQLGMDEWTGPPTATMSSTTDRPQGSMDRDPAPHDDGISYEAALKSGDIRTQLLDGTLWVRAGGQTPLQALARRWTTFVSLMFWLALGSLTTLNFWFFYVRLGGRRTIVQFHGVWFTLALVMVFVTLDVVRLVRAIRRARGTMVVSANASGIRFRNAPGATAGGEISRRDVETLRVRVHEGLFQRLYRLEVRQFGIARSQTILVSPDQRALHEVGRAIREAMGIDAPRPAAPPMAV